MHPNISKFCEFGYASIEIFYSLVVMYLPVFKFKVTSIYAYKLCISNFTC